MTDIEVLLRRTFAGHRAAVTVAGDLLDEAIARGTRRARRRQTLLSGAAAMGVVVLCASLAIVVSVRGTDESAVAPNSASAHWWSVAEITDPSIFSGDGDTTIAQMTPWQEQLVVLGTIQASTGHDDAYAWTTDDGVNWQRHRQDLPDGCSFWDGLAVLGDRLVVTCKIVETGPDGEGARIGVATTSDLESWTVMPVSANGQWFGSIVGAGPDGAVVVQALEADDPNTTHGATMRIWSSHDLATWTPIHGDTPSTLLDGSAAAIRSIDDRIVMTGVFNDWPDQAGPDTPAGMIPAVWVSTEGGPFVRTLLGSSDGSTSRSAAVMDIVPAGSRYVAVGTAGDPAAAVAWTSSDLVDWTPVTVAASEPPSGVDHAQSRSLWDVEILPDGTLLAAGGGHGSNGAIAEGWLSDDDGANWRSVGVGPDLLALWNGRTVGISGDPQDEPTFWTWGGDIAPRDSSIDLGAADDLEAGGVRWHSERAAGSRSARTTYGRRVDNVAGMQDPLAPATFEPAVGQSFTVEVESGSPNMELTLDRLVELPSTPDAPRTQPFTLTFLGPAGRHLAQGTYRLHHDGLGELDVFLVPLGPLADGRHQYDAVFN